MLYIQRDEDGNLVRVEATEFDQMSGTLPADDQEIQGWYANLAMQSSLLQLKQSDLDMIRVLDDLITVLMTKGLIRITDLPPAAQSKLLSRNQAREALGGISRLIVEEDDEIGSGLI
ncbi:tryptophan synthase subunit beta [Pseudomonas sp. BN515]|uniref:tryptophan synthase subunit beta n=1 Tax=Pseudomonas sp. BN515 TaxID=2567892 RepID=UPI00245534A9|nr:tryptophan synthase subunit beta [Pseudomonas sp. BN515]MDH4871247.1 tryptophan synthase subunit beta [Pseudomonas sp. BN515]